MPEHAELTNVVEVAPHGASGHGEASPSLLNVSGPLMALTWLTFLIVVVVLYKVAWKPILMALEQREAAVRKSIADAERARAELEQIESRSRKAIADAHAEGQAIVQSARASAAALTAATEEKARQEAQTMVAAARREIEGATERARAALRAETADLAVELAGRVVRENMDSARNRGLVEKLIQEI